ncbi:Membrane protein related to metalloendopeptidase [Geitlerinema sp. FC II]|nr:Membrane protein related to metalloendopeptidase [Geitlerinema sp. FC II]
MNLKSLALTVFILSISSSALAIYSQSNTREFSENLQDFRLIHYEPPASNPTGENPDGNSVDGGERGGENEDICPTSIALIPIVRSDGVWELTTLSHPHFFFVISNLPEGIQTAEFVLRDTDTEDLNPDVYRVEVALPDRPGIIQVELPETEEYALKINRTYRWYLKMSCLPGGESRPSSTSVNGVIFRVNPGDYPDNQIWYDLLNKRAEELMSDPNNTGLRESWNQLLIDGNLNAIDINESDSEVDLIDATEFELLPCCAPISESL